MDEVTLIEKVNIKIPIEEAIAKYDEHIKIEDNFRVFFSGAFGTGKTYFLKEYYKQKEKFIAIHIFPVNYQINTNEDIFELIKYDILLELVSLGWLNDKVKFDKSIAIQSFILQNGLSFSKLLENIPKLGKAFKTLNEIAGFINKYSEFEKELKKDNFFIAEEFAQNIESLKGTTYESDLISNLIVQSINENRTEDTEIHLIIDDLDRIDPEHIFRILNVFSAHFDTESESENKFDFDKVVLVGDIENIKRIFHSKYGIETDFNGYIDKFYSKSCYKFDNKVAVLNTLKYLLEHYKKYSKITNNHFVNLVTYHIEPLLNLLIKANSLNLRDLLRICHSRFNWNNHFSFYFAKNLRVNTWEFAVIHFINFLEFLFGNNQYKLIEALSRGESNLSSIIEEPDTLGEVLMLAGYEQITEFIGEQEMVFEDIDMKCRFKVGRSNSMDIRSFFHVSNLQYTKMDNSVKVVSDSELFYLLKKAYNIYLKIEKN